MREIKFRLIHENKIVGYERLTKKGWEWNYIELNPDKGERWVNGVANPVLHSRDQFTGLKDKNGKEIYEGDIVTLVQAKRKYTVEFIDYGFKLVHTDPKLNKMVWGYLNRVAELFFEIEVIGNIYQNQEHLQS